MTTMISEYRLSNVAPKLRSGEIDLSAHIDAICTRVASLDPEIDTLLPEPGRYDRLRKEAENLKERYPDPAERPPLYGVLVGVKDIFRADGFLTQGGSLLPARLFVGPEASSVSRFRRAGALILGKTISTEFAFAEPGPTRNPYHTGHTPGGSSSGSAAAVAAGFCPLAFGTQTIGSVSPTKTLG